MHKIPINKLAIALLFFLTFSKAPAQEPSVGNKTGMIIVTIDAAKSIARVSPMLYGLMTEEINHSYDGGLYAELIQNRIFKDNEKTPVHWSTNPPADSGAISLDWSHPINDSLTVCMKLTTGKASLNNPVGIVNDGFWGIPVRPQTSYTASFYAKSEERTGGALTVSLESNDGKVLAHAIVSTINNQWKKYSVTLTTGKDIVASAANHFVISVQKPGTTWFNLVSLFPPTYHNRKNGNRIDLMQLLADLHPAFLRCPGGNYVEGNNMAQYYNWKKTIHDLSVRPGHPGTWRYRSSDGLGILEFMEWAEDLHIEPVLAVFAGYALNREHVVAGPGLQKYVDEALEEIEYITADKKTKWGAQRAADGHPDPFQLTYVEIGNEDFFDTSGSYNGRFAQFYDAIKAKYPRLQLIATTKVSSRIPDVVDDHFYRRPADFERDTHHYDTASRKGPKIFVGEWASRLGRSPTPDLNCALGDAAWMTGMERNTDLIIMASYAPLLVNVNPGAMQWRINMIGYDALNSYGSPSYYVQKMFYENIGDVVLSSSIEGIPDTPVPVPPPNPQSPTARADSIARRATPAVMPSLSYVVTRNSKTGIIYLKVVNIIDKSQTVQFNMKGLSMVEATGSAITLSGAPDDANSITEPRKIIPIASKAGGLGKDFNYTFLPYSVTVLKIQTKL